MDFDIVEEVEGCYRDAREAGEKTTTANILPRLLPHAHPTLRAIEADVELSYQEPVYIKRRQADFYTEKIGNI